MLHLSIDSVSQKSQLTAIAFTFTVSYIIVEEARTTKTLKSIPIWLVKPI